MLRQMALKRKLCEPKVTTLIEDAQRMSHDEAMRILADGFWVTPIIVHNTGKKPFFALNVPERIIKAVYIILQWNIGTSEYSAFTAALESHTQWNDRILEIILNKLVRSAIITNEKKLILRHRVALLSPQQLSDFVSRITRSGAIIPVWDEQWKMSPKEQKRDVVRKAILKAVRLKYWRFWLQPQSISYREWPISLTWVAPEKEFQNGMDGFAVSLLHWVYSSLRHEKMNIWDMHFSVEVFGQLLEWNSPLRATIWNGTKRIELDDGWEIIASWTVYAESPRRWTQGKAKQPMHLPLLSSSWIQIDVEPSAQAHVLDAHGSWNQDYPYEILWFTQGELDLIVNQLQSRSLNGSTISEEDNGKWKTRRRIALPHPVGYVGILSLDEISWSFWVSQDDVNMLKFVLMEERGRTWQALSLEIPEKVSSLYDCMRVWNKRWSNDLQHAINNYLYDLNSRLERTPFRFIRRPWSDAIVMIYIVTESDPDIPKTNVITLVTGNKWLITCYPLQIKPPELWEMSSRFISNKRISNLNELKQAIDSWFPKDIEKMPVFLARRR